MAMPDLSELPVALEHVADIGNRERTRIVCVYGLNGRFHNTGSRLPLTGALELGRFSGRVDAAAELLPFPVLDRAGVGLGIPESNADFAVVRVRLLVTPRGDGALLIDGELRGDPGSQAVAGVLYATCHKRQQLRVDGSGVLAWLAVEAARDGRRLPAVGYALRRRIRSQLPRPGRPG